MTADWVIFYEGNEFSSSDGTPWEAPRQGVQIIAQRDDWVGYKLAHGTDYFYYDKDRGGFAGCDLFGVYDHLIRAPVPLVFFGRMMDNQAWDVYFQRVKNRLGPKQGWLPQELRNGKVPE